MVSLGGKKYLVNASIDLAGRREVNIRLTPAARLSTTAKSVIQAFARSGLPLPEPATLERLARQTPSSASTKRKIRLAALNEDKAIKLTADQLERVDALFERPQPENEPELQKREDNNPRQAILAALTERPATEDHPLMIFNHSTGSRGTWIIIPFRFKTARSDFRCVLTGRIPPGSRKIHETSLNVGSARAAWGFSFVSGAASTSLRIFGERDELELRPGLEKLRLKLRKLGLNIDDIYYKKDGFDGFPDCGPVLDYEPVDVTV